jgi:mycothiol synthase
MLTEVEDSDHDGEDVSETALRERLTWPNHDPEQDCLVIEDPNVEGALIGYSSVYAQTPQRSFLNVAIHPAWRQKGLGKALLIKALQRARETGAKQVTIDANAFNPIPNAFLQRRGFEVVESSWVLRAPADLVFEAAQWPDGYTVHDYTTVQQPSTLADAFNRSYADRWGHSENTIAATGAGMTNWISANDPTGILLVFAPNGEVVGTCTAIPASDLEPGDSEAIDIIDAPGVAPEHRHQDLYSPLVLTALHWLRLSAQHTVELQSWGDDEQTIAFYQKIGFLVKQHFFSYRYDLDES